IGVAGAFDYRISTRLRRRPKELVRESDGFGSADLERVATVVGDPGEDHSGLGRELWRRGRFARMIPHDPGPREIAVQRHGGEKARPVQELPLLKSFEPGRIVPLRMAIFAEGMRHERYPWSQ